MALVEIGASFICDGCGRPFSVQEAPAEANLELMRGTTSNVL